MSCPTLIWWFTISIHIALHISTIGPSSLPRAMNSMAIGYDNITNLIWLIGGYSHGNSLISFNVSVWNEANAFANHGYSLSGWIGSGSQAFVQTGLLVYVVDQLRNKLMVYDISTKNVNLVDTNPSSVKVQWDGCLALIGDWIIHTIVNRTYILTISTQSWKLSGNPIMPERRHQFACIIEPYGGYLYVIGGVVYLSGYRDSILKLYVKDIPNIEKYGFSRLTDTLTRTSAHMAAVLYKSDIYVAGSSDIDVIDTKTDSVVLWANLYESILYATPIIVGTRLYIFGGQSSGNGVVDYWQYFDMLSTHNLSLRQHTMYIYLYVHGNPQK